MMWNGLNQEHLFTGMVTTLVTKESFEEVPVSQMRKTIAKRLSESMFDRTTFLFNT